MTTAVRRRYARYTGVLYLLTHVTSVTAVVAYRGGQTIVGVVLEMVLALGCVGTGVLLAVLLHTHGPARAVTFASLRGVEAAVILAGAMPMLALAWGSSLGADDQAALHRLHEASFLIGQGLVIGANTIVLGSLLLTSGAVPRRLGWLGVSGGLIVLVSDVAQAAGVIPYGGALAGALAMPIFAFEIWFAIRLIVVGLNDPTAAPLATLDAATAPSN